MPFIIPAPRCIVLCDRCVRYPNGKADLHGVFNAIRSDGTFPYVHTRFSVFAQLANGLDNVPFFIDIRRARDNQLIWPGNRKIMRIPNREVVIQIVYTIDHCRFEEPGDYLLALYCDNNWVCDTKFKIR